MAQLEELTRGATVKGILPDQLVTVVDVKWFGSAVIELTYKDATGRLGNELLYRDREPTLEIVTTGRPWSFDGDGAMFRLVSEAYRIRLAHLFDPRLAVHTSLVDPLPHQITAVYGELLTRQPLRYLLADDPGAGKTIMTGLFLKELLVRGDLKRCLICCPGNLTEQWQDELWRRFQLDFTLVSRQTFEESKTGNAFAEKNLIICRLDQLARNEDIQAKLELTDWDVVVCDEAHKMSASFFNGEMRATKRYRLGQLLGKITRHFLLLTATPHNGKEEDFQLFMALLDADRFEGRFRDGVHVVDTSDLMRRMVKEQLVKFDNTPLFPERRAYTVNYKLSDLEAQLYHAVTTYVEEEMNRADRLIAEGEGRRGNMVGFALTILQRRLASSPEAIYQSLKRRRERLERRLREEKLMKRGADARVDTTEGVSLPADEDGVDEFYDETPAAEVEQTEEEIVDRASAARTIAELEAEIATLRTLERLALQVRHSGTDKKWEKLSEVLQGKGDAEAVDELFDAQGHRRKLIIFTEHRDTLNYLADQIRTLIGRPEAVVTIHGSLGREDRRKAQETFTQDKDALLLVATDAAGEGINLQRAHLMVNYDLPWNPNRIEQRFGRIHRIGQTEVCHLWNLVANETREGDVFNRLLEKLEQQRMSLGGSVFDVLGKCFTERSLRDLLIEAVRYGDRPEVKARLQQVIEHALDHDRLQQLIEERALTHETLSAARVQQIREDMERAEARRLQPHFIASFFREAFTLLGGTIREREPKRYEITHVPADVRHRDRVIGTGEPVLRRYERVTFEKSLISVQGKPLAAFICPGHPPLDAINREAAREKSIRHGHPSTLHLWWSRKPTAACRAVLFASLVDDPSSRPDEFPTEEAQQRERERLFHIIEELVKWENTNNERVLNAARREILKSTDGNPPPVLDPFCGGGSIPLEAQRLGLKAYASDLNPVAVLITKALIEIPPRFAGRPPVNPAARQTLAHERTWTGAAGLAEDVRHYGKWMRDEAEKRIRHLYPKVEIRNPKSEIRNRLTVIAWLWARTVKCPNPACGGTMPLVRSFALSTKAGKKAWVEPVIERRGGASVPARVRFEVRTGSGAPPDGTVNRRGARCIVCGEPVKFDHIRAEGKAGRMNAQLRAIVAESERGRVYLPPSEEHAAVAAKAQPAWAPDTDLPEQALGFRVQLYGMTKHRDLFTPRQLVALTTFSDLVSEARERVQQDARAAGLPDDGVPLHAGGSGAMAYADAVATYLAFVFDKAADYWSTICSWHSGRDTVRNTFARQAIPMIWDFAEGNPFSESTGNWMACIDWVRKVVAGSSYATQGQAAQLDASAALVNVDRPLISTDPPYFDNIGYADLSDFFYVWLRRSLSKIHPDLFSTLLVPKAQELVATPYRFDGDTTKAEEHFLTGLGKAFRLMRERAHPDYPVTVFYAFKQAEEDEDDNSNSTGVLPGLTVASTGWETMLAGLLSAGFQITGTLPMRTELSTRSVSIGTNALASSIVLVCRPRSENASMATRREFLAALRRELPDALKKLQHGNVAPVDFAQAAIGPGMAVFSRYAKVLEADGSPMRVRTALQLINQELDAYFAEQEGDLDADTRFCVAWFEQRGMGEGAFGEADVLARAKNTSVEGLARAGVLEAKAGKVRLLRRDEYALTPFPSPNLGEGRGVRADSRLTVWECMQHLIRALERGGEEEAARLSNQLGGGRSEDARALAYRLYAICERKGWAQEALAYNMLVASWGDVQAKAAAVAQGGQLEFLSEQLREEE